MLRKLRKKLRRQWNGMLRKKAIALQGIFHFLRDPYFAQGFPYIPFSNIIE